MSDVSIFRTLQLASASRHAFAVASVLATLTVSGCNRGHKPDVMATINGHAILQADVEKVYEAQLGEQQQQQQQAQQQPSKEQADSLRLNVLRELMDEEIVEQRAAKMNLTATNDEVNAKLSEMKAPYSEEEFVARLKASNHTLEDAKHDLRRSITIDKLLNKEINSKITVTDADVANYYNQHKAEFNLPETQYHLAQIQVTSAPSAQPGNLQGSKATTDDEARKKIQALKNRLDSGEDFGTLAMNFSERAETASSGGDMGFVPESQMKADPNVGAAILKLKPGQFTEIFPLLDSNSHRPAGYSIYKLVAREPAGQREISDPAVQQHIRQQLHDGRSQLLKAAYLEMLHDQAKIENYFAENIFKNDAK